MQNKKWFTLQTFLQDLENGDSLYKHFQIGRKVIFSWQVQNFLTTSFCQKNDRMIVFNTDSLLLIVFYSICYQCFLYVFRPTC